MTDQGTAAAYLSSWIHRGERGAVASAEALQVGISCRHPT